MRIGILSTWGGKFGNSSNFGFYNSQEIGLAKELVKYFEKVYIFKLVSKDKAREIYSVDGHSDITIISVPSPSIGINGLINVRYLDRSIECLIYFSDTQLAVPTIFRWAKKNKIKLLPYIGVIKSHSANQVNRFIMNVLFKRNINIYKKCKCLVKTPKLIDDLNSLGVKNSVLAPVCIDFSLLKTDYEKHEANALKDMYGYTQKDKIILFIGRLTQEKEPVQMIDIFKKVFESNSEYRLLMVGSGELKEKVVLQIKKYGIENYVKIVDRIPNNEIWELYRIADTFVNLNRQEIYGMAILEAMYYGCKVVAWTAPGPDFIIENGVSGWLVNSTNQLIDKLLDQSEFSTAAHERITQTLGWSTTAKIINNAVNDL